MLLRFPGICSYQQENLTGKHSKILKLRSCSKFESWYSRVKTCPGYWNIYFYISTIKSECDVSLFLPIFPYDDFKCAPVLFFTQHPYGPCFVSSVHQQEQSLRLEGTGPAPCEGWVINLQITGKFKCKMWNFLQTPHAYTFYGYFWMGWIVFGDFLCLQVPFLGPIQVPKFRCLVPLQIIEWFPLNF